MNAEHDEWRFTTTLFVIALTGVFYYFQVNGGMDMSSDHRPTYRRVGQLVNSLGPNGVLMVGGGLTVISFLSALMKPPSSTRQRSRKRRGRTPTAQQSQQPLVTFPPGMHQPVTPKPQQQAPSPAAPMAVPSPGLVALTQPAHHAADPAPLFTAPPVSPPTPNRTPWLATAYRLFVATLLAVLASTVAMGLGDAVADSEDLSVIAWLLTFTFVAWATWRFWSSARRVWGWAAVLLVVAVVVVPIDDIEPEAALGGNSAQIVQHPTR